jgi:plasmid stabilization system protein ParE
MNIIYLPLALEDISWMRRYYSVVFPDGAAKAYRHILAAEMLLKENPYIGKQLRKNVRELPIPRTPFSFIYRPDRENIEILRIWDNRADRGKLDI